MQKKWVIGITAMSLVATTAIGSTLAYFTTKTQQMTNTFTVAAPNGVTAQLREPKWDGYQFNQKMYKGNLLFGHWIDPDGTQAISCCQSLGFNQAKVMLPGDAIPKDPTMMNTTNCNQLGTLNWGQANVPVYMAMKVDTTNINNVKFDASKSGWQKLDKATYKFSNAKEVGDIYLWCGSNKDLKPDEVNSGDKTNALFDTVTVGSDAIQHTSVTAVNADKELKNFSIDLKGAAVQSRNLDAVSKLSVIESQLVGELGATMTTK